MSSEELTHPPGRPMTLAALMATLGVEVPGALADRPVRAVTWRADALGPEVIGVGMRDWFGDFHASILDRPAAALVVDRPAPSAVAPVFRVPDANLALSRLAATLEGRPADRIPVLGVTGTDGKTTTTALIDGALTRLGWRVGRLGTLGATLAGEPAPLGRTVPSPPELHALFSAMLRRGCDVAVMEAGSFGLKARRLDDVPFHLGVFTNLTRDHLDVHGDMETYAAAKARLFGPLLRAPGGWPRALLCADHPSWTRMNPPPDRWTYGLSPEADLCVEAPRFTTRGFTATLRTPLGRAPLHGRLPGVYNAQNAAAAVGALLTLGVPLRDACEAVAEAEGPPGRMQVVEDDQGIPLVVDYAHTPKGLESALAALRPLTRGRLWVIFGCGGDRDPGKRPMMGAVACAGADRVVLTSDNPRGESVEDILAQIVAGMSRPPARVEPDRAAAIGWAVRRAGPGDIVLLAGKGHEARQEIGGLSHPWSEPGAAREALVERRRRGPVEEDA